MHFHSDARCLSGSGRDRRDWERPKATLSSALTGVKLLICRDRKREILLSQPPPTQFALAVKRLNCTFAFFCLPAVWYYWWSWCPEMRWRVLLLNQMGTNVTMRQYNSWVSQFVVCPVLLCLCLSVCASFFLSVHVHYALLSFLFAFGVFLDVDVLGTSSVFAFLPWGYTWPLFTTEPLRCIALISLKCSICTTYSSNQTNMSTWGVHHTSRGTSQRWHLHTYSGNSGALQTEICI